MYKLGLIGASKGNGHPYSWAAICNGYEKDEMDQCGYPAIPEYLSKESFPEAQIKNAIVTHIWTQDKAMSNKIAKASRIENVVLSAEEMIGQIDGLLLARDDAENHYKLAANFIKAGIPVYIDKPIALSTDSLNQLYKLEQFEGQIFSCSALKYADEMAVDLNSEIGRVGHIIATVPNSWEKYAIHAIDPILSNIGDQGLIKNHYTLKKDGRTELTIEWETGLSCTILSLGTLKTPIEITYYGDSGYKKTVFDDAFSAFKKAIEHFILCIDGGIPSQKKELYDAVNIIEKGLEVAP